MKNSPRFIVVLSALAFSGLMATAAETNPARDPNAPHYPVPYHLPTVAEVTATIARVRDFMNEVVPTRIVDARTGQEITDLSQPVETATLDRGPMNFSPLAYEMGVVHSAMLRAAQVTGDAKFD